MTPSEALTTRVVVPTTFISVMSSTTATPTLLNPLKRDYNSIPDQTGGLVYVYRGGCTDHQIRLHFAFRHW